MKNIKDIFESKLTLDEKGEVNYKPGTELTLDLEGEEIMVTVIEFEKGADKVKVKDSVTGKESFYPLSKIKK